MEELINREEAVNHIEHHGQRDPNLVIFEYLTRIGEHERAKSFFEYRKKWEAVRRGNLALPFPLHVTFGLNDSCNLACAHCYRTHNKDKTSKKALECQEVFKLIEECKSLNVPSIGFGTESEMFLYKDIVKVIQFTSEKGFDDIWVCTNGQLLYSEMIELILDSKITRLLISIDAITPETYSKVRGKGFFLVMENIFSFLGKREQKKTALPILRVSFVRYNLTEHESQRFIQFWEEIANEVDIQPLIDVKNINQLKYSQIENPKCNYPESMLYINWNGDYKPCCSEFCKFLTIGNIREMNIYQAWTSDKMKDLRRQLRGEKPLNRYCINCLNSLKSNENYNSLEKKER